MELNQQEILLIDTLRNIWTNYTNAGEEQDVKQHWLQLFLFYFQYVSDEILQKPDFKSFFNPVPEETCSFLLERVYEIISKSEYYNPTQLGIEISLHENDNDALCKSIHSKDVAKLLKKNHNFAQLILRAPSDCNKIVALRTFLTNQLGHRLLEFLLKVDINLIASQKSLCNLCINLFPNCPWANANNLDFKNSNKIFKYIGRLQLFQKPNGAPTSYLQAANLHNTKSAVLEEEQPNLVTDTLSNDFEQYKNCVKSSDEIAYLLINLLIKCVANECDTLLTDQSMSIITMNFVLNSLCVSSETFGSVKNAEIIKLKLLQLIEHCLNNLFANARNINALQLQYIIARLVAALEANKQYSHAESEKHILFGLNLIIYGVLNNIVAIYGYSENSALNSSSSSKVNLYTTKFIDESVIVLSANILNELLLQYKLDLDLQILCAMIFKTLLKIIESLCKYDQHATMQCTATTLNGSVQQHPKPPRRKKLYLQQMHCRAQVQTEIQTLSCFFQGLLLDLLPNVPSELQENGARFLLRAGTCCCHYTLKTITTCFHLVPIAVPSVQKSIYKFISRKMLNALFVRTSIQLTIGNTKQNTPYCEKCDAKLKSLDFHADMLGHYRQLYERLRKLNETTPLILYLKHLKHISLLLTNGIAAGILAEIVLPLFRHYKATLISENQSPVASENECKRYWVPARVRCNSLQTAKEFEKSKKLQNSVSSESDHTTIDNKIGTGLHINIPKPTMEHTEMVALKIIHECLNIFVIYLSDIRLIKAFYNEENIKHLEDLLSYPEVIRGICDLIKIGIDNITFLGDNSQEQTTLSRRLITLQLNSSDRASQLFTSMLCRFANCSKINKHDFWLDDTATKQIQDSVPLKPLEILHISALQWSLNYELLKTSQFFYNEFAKIYSIPFENDEASEKNDNEANTKVQTTDAANVERKDLPKSKYLQHGDKTILDILKLNYNALSSFLMLPSRKKTIPAKSTSSHINLAHIFTINSSSFNSPLNAATTTENKQIDCLSNSLESLISGIDFTTASNQNSISSSSTSAVFGCDNAVDELTCDSFDDSLTQLYAEAFNETFLQKLQQQEHKSLWYHSANINLTESIVLFDIRNQKQASIQQVPQNQNILNSTEEALATALPNSEAHVSSPNSDGGILAKLFSMFGSFFGVSRSNSLYDLNETKSSEKLTCADEVLVTAELQQFCELNGDCKKLLLKLFEATMAICIKGFQNEDVEKMQKHLRKLKTLIISNASENWQQHSEEHTRTQNTITQALQTLLKIAQLSNTINEPVAEDGNGILTTADEVFVSTPTTTTAAAATSSAAATATTTHELSARARSFNNGAHTSRHNIGGVDVFYPTLLTPTLLSSASTQRSRPPQSGDSTTSAADIDYFSTRGASIICPDSELEFSEHEHDDFYLTADEGYEADAEIPEITDTDGDLEAVDLWNSFQPPSSRYRSHVLHAGLCQLVVDILIELSQLCTSNPVGWCDHLAQLANRLFVIREYLGGPLFLLRGFAPVLECSDVRLRELQQSILELIVDLNTPDVLSTFFSILSSKNPPVDLLMKYMSHICANSIKTIQPSMELEFPVAIDGKCISTSIPYISAHIDQVRNYHLHSQAITPFTRAPCIIPITHTKLWTNDGLTFSLWVQLKSAALHRSNNQLMDDDTRSSADEYLKSHLISIGSNQVMLSIYINSNMNLVFETCKPNAELKLPSPQFDDATTYEINTPINTTTAINATSPTNDNKSKTTSSATNSQTVNVLSTSGNNSPFLYALKETKLVLLRGFNHMHFFNGHTGIDGGDAYSEGSSIDLKYYRMPKNKWTHLTFAVDVLPDCLNLTVFIDGLEHHTISLPFRNLRNLIRTHSFQLIALGDGFVAKSTNQASNYTTESRSTIDGYPLRMGISNLMLFNRKITTRESILNLTAMGPDFSDLTQCQVGNWKPNYGYLNISKMYSANFGNFGEDLKLLKDSHILSYVAQQPDVVLGSETNFDVELGSYGHHYGLILYGLLQQNQLQSLQTSTILCGGLSAMLYLFARVVETSNNSLTQSTALDLLLGVALSETQLYTEFQRNDYISLIGFVIKTERCTKDIQLLRSIVNNACSQPLIIKRTSDNQLHVNENTTASLIYPRLFVSILHRYSIWHRSGAEHSHVLDMHLRCILALTREKHPHKDFNMEQLSKAGILKEMLNLCKVYVIESPHPVYISKDAAESFVSILSVFVGSPPSPSLMDEIMKLLLLLHKPSECYITHDRSKFYFLLKPQPPPSKEKSTLTTTNFSRVAAPFRRSFGRGSERRPGVAKPAANPNDADANRTARINKLRKLHARNSPYKKELHEFEENLENIADCSRLNKNAFRQISPVEARNWRLKLKQHSNMEKSPLSVNSKKVSSPKSLQKSIRKRYHLHVRKATRLLFSEDSSEERRRRSSTRNSESSLQSLATASLAAFGLDVTAADDVFNSTSTSQKRLKSLVKIDFYSSAGIIALQEGLFKLLKDFLCLLPDSSVEDVLQHYVKVEFLLVLSNHNSCAVRTAIIKLLTALTKRLTATDLQNLIKNYYPQHLGNQLSIHPTDVHMFEACLEWVSGHYGKLDAFNSYECVYIQNRFGLNALLAILTKAPINQNDFAPKAFEILKEIYLKDTEENATLIECGLLQCCMKALYNIFTKTNVMNSKTEQAIVELLTTIGKKCLKSVGHMNIIWDILNMLSFYQDKEPPNVIKGFRSIQGQLQLNWINMYFKQPFMPRNFNVTVLPDSTLSLSETKTRLDLLIDRCSQFFTVFDANYTPSENEIELFELLVVYGISTNQRCNNFIAWGLQPSRPHALRSFIINVLWISCQDEFLPSIICDGKMIKSLLWLCLLEDLPQPIANLAPLCQYLGINESDSTWNLENELSRIELNRCNISAKQKSLLEKTVYKFESLAVSIIESSMVLTRRVAELQNSERKLIMSHMKDYDETHTYTKWLEIIRRMSHEGAPWYSKDYAENSWELDVTEGPSRVHTRLRRCHLDIDKRFIMEDYRSINVNKKNGNQFNNVTAAATSFTTSCDDYYMRPLDYLISSYDQQLNISLNSQILYNFPAKYLPVDGEIDGEVIVTDHKLYFLATYHCKYFYVSCDISNITEIWLKRYQHQEKAFEIFLDTNQSLFFSLQNQDDWKIMKEVFCDKIVAPADQNKILAITQQWREGVLTNWEYLMTLNQIAGRTYNDLMQYPVFPWILSNYTTDVLDLTDKNNFRKMEKPIAVQLEENEQHYINNYTYISNTMTNMGSMILKPYHYSSHYSNSGTVLHFLVRVPPFTSYFLRYQDNNFDLPDRTFHALGTTWCLASRDSPTDVKELTPEFFCLPEMFENFERFNFGCRQNGERVEDVTLPPWCARDPRLFILIHRQALESEIVRNNLHQWIDLIFGYKQTGENAIEAINVFHPATYSVFLESEISDPIERKAVETMIKTYGQMPRQLFKNAHPASKPLSYNPSEKEIMVSVRGLRWGVYVGSPQLPKPRLGSIYKLTGAENIFSLSNTNVIYGLPAKSCIMQGAGADTFNVIFWGHEDRIIRIQPLNKAIGKPKNLLRNNQFDDITTCGADPNSNQLWCGHRSGRISVYKCSSMDATQRNGKSRQSYVHSLRLSYNSAFRKITTKSGAKMDSDLDGGDVPSMSHSNSSLVAGECIQKDGADLCWTGPTVLVRHTDEITCISLSVEFKIAVSAGRDGIAVIWDLNNWSYVRTIERPAEIHHSPITRIAISPTLGDIVTIHTIPLHSNHRSSTNNTGGTNEEVGASKSVTAAATAADECFEVTEENLDDFVNVSINPNGKSIIRLHSVNARYIQHILNEERVLAVCYSYIKEGVGVNVIATALEGGLVRLWSSWNLSFVTDIITGISNIKSLTYSTHQHLVVLTEDSKIQVWETDSLTGNSPKFPQIAFK